MKPDHPPLGLRLYSATLLHSGHCSFRTLRNSFAYECRRPPPSRLHPAHRGAARVPRAVCELVPPRLTATPRGTCRRHQLYVQRPPHL